MAKAYDDDINTRLRLAAKSIIRDDMSGKAARFAEASGLTPSFISDFLSGKRGAGLELLRALARFRPLEVLEIIQIDPRVIAMIWAENQQEVDMGKVPDALRRAARAMIELDGCTPTEAGEAAVKVWESHSYVEDGEPDYWLGKLRKCLSEASGLRPSTRLLAAKNQ